MIKPFNLFNIHQVGVLLRSQQWHTCNSSTEAVLLARVNELWSVVSAYTGDEIHLRVARRHATALKQAIAAVIDYDSNYD